MKFRTQGKIATALSILLAGGGVIFGLFKFAPEPDKKEREEVLPTVEVIPVNSSTTSVEILSQGLVEAPTETSLAAEVGGTITSVAENFEIGQAFKKGDVMLEIDSADYASALAQMEANVADAELNLALEEGRARKALRDWKNVGSTGEANDLVLRKPQVKSAKAKLVSAKAAVEKATRDMERTIIRAPYDCRIRTTYTDIGSFVAPGARVADVYELSGYEIRLPVPLDDYSFIDGAGVGSKVIYSTNVGGEEMQWTGSVIRDEGTVDRTSRSVYLVANISEQEPSKYLNPGLFVKARIAGRELENVIAFPRKALYGKDTIYVVDDEKRLNFRTVNVIRTEKDRVLVKNETSTLDGVKTGLEKGERICITNLAAAIDKMKVKIFQEKKEEGKSDPKEEKPDNVDDAKKDGEEPKG